MAKKKTKKSKDNLRSVTPFSKLLTIIIFFLVIFVAFYIRDVYQEKEKAVKAAQSVVESTP